MPQVNSTGPHDPNNTSPGNAYNSNGNGSAPLKKSDPPPIPKDQRFECVGKGLKPNTIHKFFYENVDRTKDCKQLGSNDQSLRDDGKIGGPLKTDENGYIRFRFHFTAAVEKEVDALNSVNYNLVGDKLFELRAVDSTAKKVVPFTKKDNKKRF
jgi:hypothetical protein